MCIFKKEATMIITLGLALQGCMVTTPRHALCTGQNLQARPAPTGNPLARSGITSPQPQLSSSPLPSVIRDSPSSGKAQSDMPSFLLNNATQLLLVCAMTGNCR